MMDSRLAAHSEIRGAVRSARKQRYNISPCLDNRSPDRFYHVHHLSCRSLWVPRETLALNDISW
jgi:hypothetical protein